LVALLETRLAHVVGAAVIGKQTVCVQLIELALIDAADMAHHVREQLALRVLPEQARVDFDAGKPVAVGRKARDLLVGEPRADGKTAYALVFFEQPLETSPVPQTDLHDGRKLVDRALEVLHPARLDLERVRGVVVGQHDAVAIDDDSPIGYDRNDGDAVCLGERVQLLVPYDLEIEEACGEEREDDEHERERDRETDPEVMQLELGVPELDAGIDG